MAPDETREELEKRIAELARKHAETHDDEIKAELDELSRRIDEMRKRLILGWPKEALPLFFFSKRSSSIWLTQGPVGFSSDGSKHSSS